MCVAAVEGASASPGWTRVCVYVGIEKWLCVCRVRVSTLETHAAPGMEGGRVPKGPAENSRDRDVYTFYLRSLVCFCDRRHDAWVGCRCSTASGSGSVCIPMGTTKRTP